MLITELLDAGKKPKIGQVWTDCCEQDMEFIATDEDVLEAMDAFTKTARIWDSELDALLEMRPEFTDTSSQDDVEYWDELIEESKTVKYFASVDGVQPLNLTQFESVDEAISAAKAYIDSVRGRTEQMIAFEKDGSASGISRFLRLLETAKPTYVRIKVITPGFITINPK